jgi:hypothetical protein
MFLWGHIGWLLTSLEHRAPPSQLAHSQPGMINTLVVQESSKGRFKNQVKPAIKTAKVGWPDHVEMLHLDTHATTLRRKYLSDDEVPFRNHGETADT